MISVGSQRAAPGQLAAHLLNDRDNDHVTVEEIRGFVANDLHGAFHEAHAVSKGTRCRQFLFTCSLNPPKGANASVQDLRDAADRAEKALGLTGQPRVIVIHEKQGRRHAHVVWSRIDANEMKAINLPFFKTRLNELSRELYLEHGWELPEGYRTNGWKNPLNFTMGEWQQSKRLGHDPREVKQLFRDALQRSDNLPSLRHALEERGYFLAKGDRRGFIALDIQGEAFAVARWAGVKTKDLAARLGEPDKLPSVGEVRTQIRQRMSERLRGFIREDREVQAAELKPLAMEREAMVTVQTKDRARVISGQVERLRRETRERAGRFRRGLPGVWDLLTGKTAATRRENEREAQDGKLRDREEREALVAAQLAQRRELQARMDTLNKRHRAERMELARQIGRVMQRDGVGRSPAHDRPNPEPGLGLDL